MGIASVHKEIEEIEKTGVPAEKIVIGGFSLGGAASIAGGLSYPKKIGLSFYQRLGSQQRGNVENVTNNSSRLVLLRESGRRYRPETESEVRRHTQDCAV